MMKTIYFVVVNYNNSSNTEALCDSLIKQSGFGVDFEIKCIVVDNSNDNNDSKKLNHYCNTIKWIKIITCTDNPGYFGGLNRGLKEIDDKNNYVIIGNNDLIFGSEFCRTLLSKNYSADIFAISPDVITFNGVHQNPHILRRISSFRRFQFDVYFSHYQCARLLNFVRRLLPRKKHPNKDQELLAGEIHMGVGAIFVLTPNYFLHFGELNCPVFLYGEEAFISEQIHSKSGILYFDPDLTVVHSERGTLSKVPKRTAYEYEKNGYPLYRDLL